MAVPQDIRAVPRPVNTIVDDSGRDGPKRFAVRQRASSKYVPGGNPQPRNGRVIGHIIDHRYVPVSSPMASEEADMLSYGASALVKAVTGDLFSNLLDVFDSDHVHGNPEGGEAPDHRKQDVHPLQAHIRLQGLPGRCPFQKFHYGSSAEDWTGRQAAQALLPAAAFTGGSRPPYSH